MIDGLCAQVHGVSANLPTYSRRKVDYVHEDILNKDSTTEAASGVDAVIHFAAEAGVDRSMFQIRG